ncbi:MAG: ribonuclease [Firmicutes bacterium]|nr:ribonuclease [Bacillota bacterium]
MKRTVFKRIVILLLAFIVALAALSGCIRRPKPEPTPAPAPDPEPSPTEIESPFPGVEVTEDGHYDGKYEVAAYLILFGHLPENYLTKDEAEALGWEGGSVEKVAPGYCIGGDRYGNYEKALPTKKGRTYYECDIDTLDYKNRGSRRLIYSNDGLIYYSKDHYKTFELIWGEE